MRRSERASGAEGLKALAKQDFDLLLCDLMMPGMDGIQLLRKALDIDPNLVGIIMTGQGTISSAVEAMKVGAFDYVLKPFNLQTMLPILARAMEVRRLRMENVRLRQYVERLSYESPRYQMIGSGPAMQRVVQLIEKVAPTDATVLVRGQSGTGKELVARALHRNSARRGRPLVTINCAALQESLLESELFGHEKGCLYRGATGQAGAVRGGRGRHTLHRRSSRDVSRPASETPARAGRRPLPPSRRHQGVSRRRANHRGHEQAARGRAEGGPLPGRPLLPAQCRQHRPPAAPRTPRGHPRTGRALLDHAPAWKSALPGSHADAMQALLNYGWPGNIRELANVLERAQILAEDTSITLDDLPEAMQVVPPPAEASSTDPLNLSAGGT